MGGQSGAHHGLPGFSSQPSLFRQLSAQDAHLPQVLCAGLQPAWKHSKSSEVSLPASFPAGRCMPSSRILPLVIDCKAARSMTEMCICQKSVSSPLSVTATALCIRCMFWSSQQLQALSRSVLLCRMPPAADCKHCFTATPLTEKEDPPSVLLKLAHLAQVYSNPAFHYNLPGPVSLKLVWNNISIAYSGK